MQLWTIDNGEGRRRALIVVDGKNSACVCRCTCV